MNKHQPEPMTEAKGAADLYDLAIQTDRKIKSNRPDIVVKDYKRKVCFQLICQCQQLLLSDSIWIRDQSETIAWIG